MLAYEAYICCIEAHVDGMQVGIYVFRAGGRFDLADFGLIEPVVLEVRLVCSGFWVDSEKEKTKDDS